MTNYREIVTKAVIGKAKKTTTQNFTVRPEETPNTVLGCWIINYTFNGVNHNGSVLINGAFDINIWYSYDNDTKTTVTTERITYSDIMNVRLKNETMLDNTSEIIVRSLKQPTVTDVKIENGSVVLSVDKEMGVEVVGNTKVNVAVEDLDDDYEELIDDEIESSIDSIDEDYINDNPETD